jgi:xylulokinase
VTHTGSIHALDFGTTTIKAASFDSELQLRQACAQETPTRRTRDGWADQDAEELWSIGAALLRQLADDAPPEAIVITSVGEAGVLTDAEGRALTPAITWFDRRTKEQALWWDARVGSNRLYAITGLPLDGSYAANKLLWLRDHDEVVFNHACWWLSIADFIQLQLTGEASTVPSLASRTMLYDQRTRDWSDELLTAAQIPRRILPPIVESGTQIGTVSAAASRLTNVPAGTPVVAGGHDHLCSALALRAGTTRTVDSTGTAEVAVTPTLSPLNVPAAEAGHIACYADVEAERYVCSARVGLAGGLLEWARRELFADADYATIVAALENARLPSGLLCLPTFGRPASPFFDPTTAVGTIVGLTVDHSRTDLLVALLEGACLSLRANLETIERITETTIDEIAVGGGAARNPAWLQLKADVTQRRVERSTVEETTLLGAACLATTATNPTDTPAEAARRAWKPHASYEPDPALGEQYDLLYQRYCELPAAIAPAAQTTLHLKRGNHHR